MDGPMTGQISIYADFDAGDYEVLYLPRGDANSQFKAQRCPLLKKENTHTLYVTLLPFPLSIWLCLFVLLTVSRSRT
jgi:hypothetical protein